MRSLPIPETYDKDFVLLMIQTGLWVLFLYAFKPTKGQ